MTSCSASRLKAGLLVPSAHLSPGRVPGDLCSAVVGSAQSKHSARQCKSETPATFARRPVSRLILVRGFQGFAVVRVLPIPPFSSVLALRSVFSVVPFS